MASSLLDAAGYDHVHVVIPAIVVAIVIVYLVGVVERHAMPMDWFSSFRRARYDCTAR